jgi:NADH:ubiquinone oxidoreductase subunit C
MSTMASVTSAVPPEVLAKPAARVLSEALGDNLLSIEDFRGDLAVTVERRAWVEAARLLRDRPELDFKLFLDLCGVDYLDREGRPAPPASRSCCTCTRSRRSTTCG